MKTTIPNAQGVSRATWCAPGWLSMAGLCVGLAACGPAADSPGASEHVASSRASDTLYDQYAPDTIQTIIGSAKDLTDFYTGVGTAIDMANKLGQLFGLFGSSPSVPDQINALKAQLDTLASALDWKMVALDFNNTQWAPVSAALMEAQQRNVAAGDLIPRGSAYDANSHTAVVAAGGLVMFERLFVQASTDGPWKSIIANNKPDILDNNQVFDWRLALPWFTQVIAMRLAVMATVDPLFTTDTSFNSELDGTEAFPGYRRVLEARLKQMVAGVRCGAKDVIYDFSDADGPKLAYGGTNIACADVNTGVAATSTYAIPGFDDCLRTGFLDSACAARLPGQATVPQIQDGLRRQVLRKMPIFEVQAMIDTLYLYTHPAKDLTEEFGQIPVAAAPNLCLDVPGGNAAPGTQVQLWTCQYNNAQWWQYDRKSGQIYNPALNMCLEVQSPNDVLRENLFPGGTADIGYCGSPVPTWQKWTYDPEGKILRSALNTVLDVREGNLQPGSPVWLWDVNGSIAQQWRADPPFTVQVQTPSQCGRLLADEGLLANQSASSCDGSLSLILASDANVVLQETITYNPPPPPPSPGGTAFSQWESCTSGSLPGMLVMQGDGNLVLYNPMGGPVWASNTWNHPGAFLALQDGGMTIYDTNGQSIWRSTTWCQ